MEASEPIVANDLYGQPIKVGTTVRYVTTRTLGKVVDVKAEEGKTWAQLDSTQLYYDTHYLTVTDEKVVAEEDEESVKIDVADLEKKIKDVTVTDSSCEGGG